MYPELFSTLLFQMMQSALIIQGRMKKEEELELTEKKIYLKYYYRKSRKTSEYINRATE